MVSYIVSMSTVFGIWILVRSKTNAIEIETEEVQKSLDQMIEKELSLNVVKMKLGAIVDMVGDNGKTYQLWSETGKLLGETSGVGDMRINVSGKVTFSGIVSDIHDLKVIESNLVDALDAKAAAIRGITRFPEGYRYTVEIDGLVEVGI